LPMGAVLSRFGDELRRKCFHRQSSAMDRVLLYERKNPS
jgi:hypothetical protein